MPTQEIYQGKLFEVRGWVDGDSCLALDFLRELAKSGDSDAERLFYLIKRTADEGVLQNNRHVRSLGDGIFEFKAPNTARICFFYDKDVRSLIICTHGFTGKKGNEKKYIQRQIEKAVKIKKDYFGEKG